MQITNILLSIIPFIPFFILLFFIPKLNKKKDTDFDSERERIQLATKLDEAKSSLSQQDELIRQLNDENDHLREELAVANTKLESYTEASETLQLIMADKFRTLASDLLNEKTKTLDQQSQNILKPLREEIERMQKTVTDTYAQGLKDQSNLIGELKKMQDLNSSLQKEAHELSIALKGDSKIQGDWGEVVLERVLESSGLSKDREYEIQPSFTLDDNKKLRPDAIVRLPENKCIIIDSKVSLTAYDRFVNATSEEERKQALNAHKASLKKHIEELSNKSYTQRLNLNTVECVLMFIPIESAFSAVAKEEKDFFEMAWKRNVVIVTPITLMATLRTINTTWKQVRQTQNALEIAKRGGLLYDKVTNFVESMDQVDAQLNTLRNSFDTAKKQLSDGSGNILRQIEMLRELGTKSTKDLSNTKIGKAALED